MATDPYDDNDDDPTLQRPPTPSGIAARFGSGIRAAAISPVAPPIPLGELLDSAELGFPEEEDTAVDRAPLEARDEETAAEPPRRIMTEALPVLSTMPAVPADNETDTVTLPVDIAVLLRKASVGSDPPPSPLGEPVRPSKRDDER